MQFHLNWDVGLGLSFALLGGYLFARGWMMPVGTSGVPGPGFFPLLVGGLLFVLGAGLALRGFGGAPDYWNRGWWDPAMARIFGVVAVCVLYLILWEAVHFLLATTVLLAAIYLMLGVRWWKAVALALGFTVTLYGVFQWLFNIRF